MRLCGATLTALVILASNGRQMNHILVVRDGLLLSDMQWSVEEDKALLSGRTVGRCILWLDHNSVEVDIKTSEIALLIVHHNSSTSSEYIDSLLTSIMISTLLLVLFGLLPQVFSHRTVELDWDITWVTASPDGFSRPVVGINNRFPCPTINVRYSKEL
jgi:hypothetical protein